MQKVIFRRFGASMLVMSMWIGAFAVSPSAISAQVNPKDTKEVPKQDKKGKDRRERMGIATTPRSCPVHVMHMCHVFLLCSLSHVMIRSVPAHISEGWCTQRGVVWCGVV